MSDWTGRPTLPPQCVGRPKRLDPPLTTVESLCYTVRDSPSHHGSTVRTVRILTKRIEYGEELWQITVEIPWQSLWIQHRSHTRGRINTVEVDFLRIFLRHFGGGGACCWVSKYFTVVYHCCHCCLYCMLHCATICPTALLLYATALLYSLYYSTTLVFYRLPPALYDCELSALSQPFLYSFLPIAVAFLY